MMICCSALNWLARQQCCCLSLLLHAQPLPGPTQLASSTVPDVWLQLLEGAASLGLKHPTCTIVSRLGKQILQQQAQSTGLQQQLAAQQQEIDQQAGIVTQQSRQIRALKVQLEAQQDELAAARQQITAQQAVKAAATSREAELTARVQAVEGQVQQLLQALQARS